MKTYIERTNKKIPSIDIKQHNIVQRYCDDIDLSYNDGYVVNYKNKTKKRFTNIKAARRWIKNPKVETCIKVECVQETSVMAFIEALTQSLTQVPNDKINTAQIKTSRVEIFYETKD